MKTRFSRLMATASVSALASLSFGAPAFAQEAPDEEVVLETVIVEGRRAAIENAAAQERAADALTSIVTADDIGQFGDPTVAESLQRIPGVSINRVGGDGQQVSIRGLPTEFATVTIDGKRLGSSDGEVNSTNLDFFAADNLASIEVSKALTPEMDADAIAGSIDLKSSTAFTRGENSYGGRAELGFPDKNGATNPKLSAEFTRIVDLEDGVRIGLAGGLAWSKRETFTDEIRVGDGLLFFVNEGSATSPELDDATDCDDPDYIECYLQPRELDLRNDIRDTERLSLNGAFEIDFGNTILTARGTFADVDSSDVNSRQTFSFDRSTNSREIIAIGPNSGILEDSRSERRIRPQSNTEQVYTFGVEGDTVFGSTGWSANYGFDVSKNERDDSEIEGRFRVDDIRFEFSNLDEDGIDVVLAEEQGRSNRPDPTDPNEYELNGDRVNERFERSVDDYTTVYADFAKEMSLFGREAEVQFGAKARKREREFGFDRFEYDVASGVTLAQFNPAARPARTSLDIVFAPPIGPLETALRDLVANGTRISDPFADVASVEGDYTAEEDVAAAYGQLTFQPAANVQIVTGLRVEQTDYTSTGTRVRDLAFSDESTSVLADALAAGGVSAADIAAFEASREAVLRQEAFVGGNDYTKLFPSVVMKWDARDDIVVRASYTEGLKRPEFREAAAIADIVTREDGLDDDILEDIIDTRFGGQLTSVGAVQSAIDAAVAQARIDENDPTLSQFVTFGNRVRNPELEPLTSKNFDASVSWYPNRSTVLTVAAFYKDIENFIVEVGLAGAEVTRFGFDPDDGTATSTGLSRLNTYVNGDKAEIYGLEVSYYQAYTFLPKPLDGLFVEANATFSDSEATASLVNRTFTFPDQSDVVGNLSLGWENDRMSFRIAGVYQGERLRGINQALLEDSNDIAGDVIEDARTQIDLSARYDITDSAQIYFDAINITDAEDLRYFRGGNTADNGPIVSQYENYGATYQFGVRVRF